ncbi:sugar phosphate isomerase/epimerase family protein [uncultured Amnibacterium sp.]|uniref:sugar phosphate isomerase/epimerase family protein n=1 Tax=uncultured Amnibacterium sp. TaxID=1631851 RepID=UPI0035CAC0D2
MPIAAVQSWSLQRTLGRPVAADAFPWPGGMEAHPGDGLPLLELPARLADRGFGVVQLCHFQLPTRDAGYLADLRGALDDAGVTLDALLLDTGDLSSPDHGDEVEGWARAWIDDAAALGAARIRIVGGRQEPSAEAIGAAAARLRRLVEGSPGVRIVTENWRELLSGPDVVLQLLDETQGLVGLLVDLGNWGGPTKYDDLRRIAPFAETCHAKCHASADGTGLDAADYTRSLQVLADAGFDGALALVFEGPGDDEWAGLDAERAIVREVFPNA